MIKRAALFLMALTVLTLIAVSALQLGSEHYKGQTLSNSKPLTLEIKKGSSIRTVANSLEKLGAIENPQWLVWHTRLTGDAPRIQAGNYQIPAGISISRLIDMLTSGEVQQLSFTMVEGRTLQQLLDTLKNESTIQQSTPPLDYDSIAETLGIEGNPEGLFFPDTYFYTAGTRDIDLLGRANKRMQQVLLDEWEKRDAKLPYETAYEALIMASIVERETGVPSERSEIAGVFVRRLHKKMRLQTDPTVIYGLGRDYQGNITRAHLNQYTAYNTYRIKGLPPTPIALAGREAIHAALHPLSGTTLYFVAKGDGSHQFSTTLEEHNKAVRQYQYKRSKNYRSSPPTGELK